MNKQIVKTTKKEMSKKGMSKYRLGTDAKAVQPHTNIYRMLNLEVAAVPESWQSVFDLLGAELMMIPADKLEAVKAVLAKK